MRNMRKEVFRNLKWNKILCWLFGHQWIREVVPIYKWCFRCGKTEHGKNNI
jgi:hypothetical protein